MAINVKNFHGKSVLVKGVLDASLASAATVVLTLPENCFDVAFISVFLADGTLVVPGATTYSAKITAQSVSSDKNVPATVTITAGSGGLASGAVVAVAAVC